uniref:Endonuclease/exonuclease/phosphatase domain-containing protein n=1 Tax=Fagus sylvatica TaxID=28930 RepID=A0A2N9HG92_FAGSY
MKKLEKLRYHINLPPPTLPPPPPHPFFIPPPPPFIASNQPPYIIPQPYTVSLPTNSPPPPNAYQQTQPALPHAERLTFNPNNSRPEYIPPRHTITKTHTPFRIDAKTFTLEFEGGRTDPYHIKERRNRYRGSLWIGLRGLKWLLGELEALRKPAAKLVGFFQFYRDGYRTLELSCLSNRGGRYLELCDYHSGSQQGGVRVPEGKHGAGWTLFDRELRSYFLGEKFAGAATDRVDHGQRGNRFTRKQNSRDFRNHREDFSGENLLKIVNASDSSRNARDMLSKEELRPTREFKFHWAPKIKTLRITKRDGLPRITEWVGLNDTKPTSRPTSPAESPKPFDLSPPEASGEHSKPRETPSEAMSDFEAVESETINEMGCKTHNPMVLKEKIGEVFGRKNLGCETRSEGGESELATEIVRMDSPIAGAQSQGVDLPSDSSVATQNGEVCSAEPNVEDLEDGEIDGDEIGPGSAEVVRPEPSFVTDLALVRVDLAADLPDSQLSVMEHHSQPERTKCETEPTAPLICEPLAVVAPPNVSVAPRKPHNLDRSTWVNIKYKGICELMGFPLESHEQQCLALLRRIEAARFIKKGEMGTRKMVVSGTKGARELRNLLKLLTWNVRGLNDPKKRVVLKNWLRKWKVDVVCLQETKLDKVDGRMISSIWGNRFAGWEVLDAAHTAGGVLLLWDKRVVDRIDSKVGMFSVSCHWKSLGDGFEWVGTGVYGPNRDDSRSELWAELVEVRNQWSQPWCIFGDFNVVRFPSERRGCVRVTPAMEEFSDFIDGFNLIDLPLNGGMYSWCNGAANPSMSRIDRVLVSTDWEEHYPDVVQKLMPKPISDHNPMLLEAGGMARGKSSFKFENMWLKVPEFVDIVQNWWSGYSYSGTPSFVLAQKLKALKGDLKEWNRLEFGDVGIKRQQLECELQAYDEKESLSSLSPEEHILREVCKAELERVAQLEEVSWRQKSRSLWLKEGDNNTKFFHKMANSHRRYNYMDKVEVDGVVFEEESEIREKVVHFYESLYQEAETWRPTVDGVRV